MAAQAISPAGAVEEFHRITVGLAEDTTDVTCAVCGLLEHVGGPPGCAESYVAHGSHHAIVTGHTVTERHVRLTVISERP